MNSEIDPRELDLQYKPFPRFSEWSGCTADAKRLQESETTLAKVRQDASAERMSKALEIVRRAGT